jgi:diguanylate cyclase (GGDEF)-like protein
MVVQIEDVTARREAERALSEQALRDAVTGLPNRRALNDRANSALQRMRRKPGMVSILFCDLDHFKEVNDSLGHQVGDLLLVEAAHRLQSVVRPEDTLARLGGDEFVFLGEGFASTADVVRLAGRMQECLGAPWVHDQQEFRPAMCVGIAVTSDPEVSVDELLRRADLAMYRAKAAGRGRIEVYQRTVDEAVQQSVLVQHRLRDAIERGGLLLHYQPIVRLPDREVVGVEALVRM